MSKVGLIRQQEVELPEVLDISFINKNTDYQQGVQQARKIQSISKEMQTIQVPVVLTDQQARIIVEKLLYAAWAGRNSFKFKLPRAYTYLEPTDVIYVVDDSNGAVHTIRLTKKVESRSGAIEFEGRSESSSVFTQSAVSGAASVGSTVSKEKGPTKLTLLDIPLLRDTDDEYGFYMGCSGYTSGWSGASIYKSSDNGQSYASIDSVTVSAIIGSATTALADWTGGNVFDEKNTVTVELLSGELSSTTELAVLNGANAAVLGDEIIQFKNASLVSERVYTLSGLLRGRRGTEDYIPIHLIGDRFVLLTTASILPVAGSASELDAERLYKAVTSGDSLANADEEYFINRGEALRPYAPVGFYGGKQANGDFIVGWRRRTRKSGEWNNSAEVPLAEDSELYDVAVVSSEAAIAAIDRSNPLKITTSGAHNLVTNEQVAISTLNGMKEISDRVFTVTVLDATNFTIALDATDFSPWISGGTVSRIRGIVQVAAATSLTYTVAQQTTHFGSQQSTLSVRVFQISGKVGRGRSGRANY